MPEILQVNKKTKEIKRIPVTENHYKLLMSRNHFKNGGTYLAPAEFGAYFGALPEPEQVQEPEPIKEPEPEFLRFETGKHEINTQAADSLMATMGFKRAEEKGMTDENEISEKLIEVKVDQPTFFNDNVKFESVEKPEPTPEPEAKPKRTRKTKKPE